MVGEALCREVGGLGAGPNWASHLLCDLSISLTLSGSHFLVFSPSSRFMAQYNVIGRLLHQVELLVCFTVYLDQTFVKFALRTNKIGICYSIAT